MGKAVQESGQLVAERIKHYRFLISEYEQIKSKRHPRYRKVGDFYKAQQIDRRVFLKYYHRFKQSPNDVKSLLPRKRGPIYKTRRPIFFIEKKVIDLRLKGNNKYEISLALSTTLKKYSPSPSGVYNILKRHNLNRLNPKMKEEEEKRKIIKEKAGELGHIDAHYLKPSLIKGETRRSFLLALIDDCSRVMCAEVIPDLKSITVMFATMRLINIMSDIYGIKFAEFMTDNGSEFGNKNMKNKAEHPFERLLLEMGIKHRYTRPYRPQTNGKVERLWRTIDEDMLQNTDYDSLEALTQELAEYQIYYNHQRPHQGIAGKTPIQRLEAVDKIE